MTTYQQTLAIDILNYLCGISREAHAVEIHPADHTKIPFYASVSFSIDGCPKRFYRNAFGFTEDSAIENLYRIVTGNPIDPVVDEVVQE